jgi:C4-dicarboxylate-specific signal transduction histidine kinase
LLLGLRRFPLRLLLAVLPTAACAAAMFLCFRMMRHSDMPADGRVESDDLDTLRREVADLREELARARSVPSDAAAADGMRHIVRRGSSETASESRWLRPPTPAGATSATGHPDG